MDIDGWVPVSEPTMKATTRCNDELVDLGLILMLSAIVNLQSREPQCVTGQTGNMASRT